MTNRLNAAIVGAATLAMSGPAFAGLTIEPVFNSVDGQGELFTADTVIIGFFNPGIVPILDADEPGETVIYPAGYPSDLSLVPNDLKTPEELAAVPVQTFFFNNTSYVMTSFTVRIIGTAVEPEPFNFTIVEDPNVDAFFGDVNGDGFTGLSDIFSVVTLLDAGRTIMFSGGEIRPGDRFTDFNFAMTADGQPFLAAFEASFDGYLVPLPAAAPLLLAGFAGLAGLARRKRFTAR